MSNRESRKIKMLNRIGNKCQCCGNRFTDLKNAHFHHESSVTKVNNISDVLDGSMDRLMKERKKCIVLCKSCHILLHKTMGKQVTKKQTRTFIKDIFPTL